MTTALSADQRRQIERMRNLEWLREGAERLRAERWARLRPGVRALA